MADFSLIFSFPDDSESFVLGFEAGQIYNRMVDGEAEIDRTDIPVHTANRECFDRMARAMGYVGRFEPIPELSDWMEGTFTKLRFQPTVITGGKDAPEHAD